MKFNIIILSLGIVGIGSIVHGQETAPIQPLIQEVITAVGGPEIVEDGKTCLGLQISESIDPPMDMFFDKQTKLLVRMDWRSDIYRFNEWCEHDGVRYASKTIMFRRATGKPWFYHKITELERLKELPSELPR